MIRRPHDVGMTVALTLVVFAISQTASGQTPQSPSAQNTSQPQAMSTPAPAPDAAQSQAISQTGLLPLFAVDMDIDPSWVDGDAAPSTAPQFSHNGVNDAVDQAWTALKPAGFNAIRFPVRLDDPKSPVRLANLCLWASSHGVRLIPVLQGTDGMHKTASKMASAVGTFTAAVISTLKAVPGSGLTPYAQISFYQLERPLNQTGSYPGLKTATAQQLLLTTSAALRQSETQALEGTSVQGTPICVAASYDFELVRQGAIAGVPLDPAVEQRAQDTLKEFLKGLTSPNIDAINIEWFPKSISSGDVDRFVTLLGVLKQSFADKEITLTTGFSSAFNPPDQALQFYAAGISNLGSYRASDGVDSKFVGVVVEQAFKGSNADLPTPAGTTDPSQWKWNDRAQQLSAMWSKGTASADMAWWVKKVQDSMGFVALNPVSGSAPGLTPLPSLQVLEDIASTLNQASQQLPPAAPTGDATVAGAPSASANAIPGAGVGATATPGYVPGAQPSAQAAGSPFQQLLMTLLQQFSQQIAVKLMTKLDGSNGQGRYMDRANPGAAAANGTVPSAFTPPSSPAATSGMSSIANTVWIAPSDISVSTTSPTVGQSVVVTAQVHNQSSDQDISGLTVELVNPTNPAAIGQSVQSGVTVPRSGAVPVQLTWAPDTTSIGDTQLVLQALDSTGQTVTTVAIPKMTVQNIGSSLSSTAVNTGGSTTDTTVNPAADAGSTTNATSTTSSGNVAPSTNSIPGSVPGSTPMPQLTVTGFGFADSSASSAGQIPQLQAQISNPSQLPTQSGQAQLYLDGAPQQMQTVGAILPSGTLILQFPATPAATGQHSLQLVVTTSDGTNASSTLTANVTAAATTTQAGSSPTSQPTQSTLRPSRNLRPAVPITFRISNVTQSTTSSPGGGIAKTPAATLAPHSTYAQTLSPAPSVRTATAAPAPAPQGRVVRTITPVPQQTSTSGSGNQSAAIPRSPAVRTIVPGQVNPGLASSTAPAAQVTNSSPVGTRTIASGAVRTITPTSTVPAAASVSQTPLTTNSANPAIATRTIVPAAPQVPGTVPGQNNASMQTNARMPAGIRPGMAGGLDLAISNGDVHLFPVPPRAGQTATFTAAVKNLGMVAAHGARVQFVLVENGQRLAWSQPLTVDVPPHGMAQTQWSTPIPAASGLEIVVTVAANGDTNPANNQAMVPFAVAFAPPKVQTRAH